jgi:hypothetical protein
MGTFLTLQAKANQSNGNLTAIKKFAFKEHFSKSETKINQLEVFASPRYSQNNEQQGILI